jgi:hypothetical protein
VQLTKEQLITEILNKLKEEDQLQKVSLVYAIHQFAKQLANTIEDKPLKVPNFSLAPVPRGIDTSSDESDEEDKDDADALDAQLGLPWKKSKRKKRATKRRRALLNTSQELLPVKIAISTAIGIDQVVAA